MSTQFLPDSIVDMAENLGLAGLGMEAEETATRLLATRETQGQAILGSGQVQFGGIGEGEISTDAEEATDFGGEDPDMVEGDRAAVPVVPSHGRGVARHTSRKIAAAVGGRLEAERFTAGEARQNAKFLFRGMNLGFMTEMEARRSIAVPDHVEAEWRTFAEANAADGVILIAILRFRRRVMQEFNRLVAPSASSAGGPCGAAGHSTPECGPCYVTPGEVSQVVG